MKVTCLQMDIRFCHPEESFRHVTGLIEQAMLEKPDVLVLPEAWNSGFAPHADSSSLADRDGARVTA